jgi:hypothetical protein
MGPPPELFYYDGPLLIAWEAVFGSVAVYVTSGGLRPYWELSPLPAEQRPALERELGRLRNARTCSRGPVGGYLWSVDDGFTVWSFDAAEPVVASGRDGVLQVGSQVIDRRDVARVRSFLGPEGFGQRGVAVELFDTSRVTVAEEHDGWAERDPTYDATTVMLDAAWASFLGRDLAGWLGVPHEDEIP